ncbi:NAD(P)-dependent dehydrogenase (short-subunit alcohol dehydrogenase family) [Antricoccus suffuscus]|uniref:NAD(P)-dependent dehydrogenase (Short-subunit alcohol dehydrogenase family) n=1 Tax=Antricoccus suffuscus TaxID=1629062 RepID=A0A2T1A3G5_9ACTN|nr:SDR family NAD(P)-dependent oxidoreductase [Antricoccus suffuscus]PRZ42848.1 NAD(P)-dependent dehydrogenase (short-subunit alcohol dehydrogenase family) [Antricoccus suffuscus]
MADFQGRSVVITGGARGLGATVAEEFVKRGARVAIVDLDSDEFLATRDRLSKLGDVLAITADVSQESDVKSYVQQAVEAYGGIDVFFNNAGIEGKVAVPLVETAVEDFDRVISVNLRGVFLGLKHVLPVMNAKKSGSVINTSSVAGLRGSMGIGPYTASKHGVVGLTRTAALESAPYGVRVNSIHPSPVNTRMMRALEKGVNPADPEAAQARFTSNIPLGRYAESTDIANLVLFLASDESNFLTGVQYRVDGGMGAH